MPFADVGDVRLFFTDEGSGDLPLLLVHGYTSDSHDWSWQLPHLVAGHRVIAVDLRGHGRSSAPPKGYTTAQFAADLAGLLDHLGIDRVVAFGHSMGGSVVSGLAVDFPDRVAAVVAVDPAYLLPDEMAGGMRPMLDLLADTDPVPFVQRLVGGMDSPARHPALRTWQVRRIAGMEGHVLSQSLAAQVTGMALRSHSEPYLRRRTCPVLSFYADPSRSDAEQAVFTDPRSRVVTWEGAGHWLHQERPAEFNSLVTTWLASIA
ncbi:alpha/beta fold hydrolase [Pseudofrankia asymbiotica]|uniref:Alpha/beta hydrolase n=1 Tax=Pseudofrankia asymbiotica TaxID=1834516 RepID=A0A1V2I8T6_9ACTN|nr:alpha/beta hydrolase [Pseudofrankia asymbiotica]ONH28711.1 alpha/beta hydrolase [Pseudofrankia asymbiotica]